MAVVVTMTRISICPGSRLPTIRHKSLCKQTENSACIAPTESQLPQRSLLSSFDCEDKCLNLRTRIACIVLCPVADTSSTSCWKGCRSACCLNLEALSRETGIVGLQQRGIETRQARLTSNILSFLDTVLRAAAGSRGIYNTP